MYAVLHARVGLFGGRSFNASDSKVFEARSRKVLEYFWKNTGIEARVGDSKLYSSENVASLKDLPFITRIPRTAEARLKILRILAWQPILDIYRISGHAG